MNHASPPLPRCALSDAGAASLPSLPLDDHPFDVALRAALADEPVLDLRLPEVVIAPRSAPERMTPPPMVPVSLVPMVRERAIEAFDSTTEGVETPPGQLEVLLRICMASLFAVNGISAFVDPGPFVDLLADVPLLGSLPASLLDGLVWFAGLNDLLLAAAIIFMQRRRLVYIWMAIWLANIAAVKILAVL